MLYITYKRIITIPSRFEEQSGNYIYNVLIYHLLPYYDTNPNMYLQDNANEISVGAVVTQY